MKKILWLLLLLCLFLQPVRAADERFGAEELPGALTEEASDLMGSRSVLDYEGLGDGFRQIVSGAVKKSGGAVAQGLGLCSQILAIVLLSALLRGISPKTDQQAMVLCGVLSIGVLCVGRISGFFAQAAETVDSMTAFCAFLYSTLAAATAATGAIGSSTALYAVTVVVCSVMARLVQTLLLPAISCYMALMVANYAVGDDSLKIAGDTLKQLIVSGMKLVVIAFTAYMSLTGVISGSADSAAVKAAKLAISTAVPVVGSLIADASETLLVSAGLIRSGVGVFGLLGVLAVSIVPFLETGIQYLMLKFTAAAAGVAGEKELSGLIGAMAGALGLLTAVTGVCTLILMIGCVCFMRAAAP